MDISEAKNTKRNRPPEKSIRFPLAIHDKLLKLCERLGRNQSEVFIQMVEYFYRTKKDPADINDELLKTTLFKNHDNYIRFIKAQENTLLIPIKTEVDRMIQSQIKIIDFFNMHVLKANKDILSGQQAQGQSIDNLLKIISDKLDTKESLKLKFLFILNHYSKVNSNASAKEKEIILQETKQHISKL
jgi:hypothetical protein